MIVAYPTSQNETVSCLDPGELSAGAEPPLDLLISSAEGISVVALSRGRSYVIGRVAKADVYTRDPTISRSHAVLHVGAAIELQDNGSMNGTRIAGETVSPGVRVRLSDGVPFALGSATFVVLRGRGRAADALPIPTVESEPGDANAGPVVVDPAMKRLYGLIDFIGPAALNVLVLGETGTGKEVFASELHRSSTRCDEPFLQLNCASLPESVLEAELFGYERGAFTGALQARAGLFEAADGGTLFLDEIGDMPLVMQAKILRVVESGEFLRLGCVKPRTTNIRIIAATHRDLRRDVAAGRFRADLFFRLNGMSITLPPLRVRTADIPPLAARFVRLAAAKAGRLPLPLTKASIDRLVSYPWPGNVRELRNSVERAFVMCRGPAITPDFIHLDEVLDAAPKTPFNLDAVADGRAHTPVSGQLAAPPLAGPSSSLTSLPLREELETLERDRILEALSRYGGNQSKAAGSLGMSRYTLMARMDRHRIARPRKV